MQTYQTRERESGDSAAAGYEAWYTNSKGACFDLRERTLFSQAVRRAQHPAPPRLLDLGAGTGRITEAVAPSADLVAAVDFSLQSLRVLSKKNLRSAIVVQADAVALPFPNHTFDAMVSWQVLQHLVLPDLLALLRECRRVLKPGGRFFFSVYNVSYWRCHGICEDVDWNGLYYRRLDPNYLRRLAAASGFSGARVSYYKALPSSPPALGALPGSAALATADRIICGVPILRRFGSAYLFAEFR